MAKAKNHRTPIPGTPWILILVSHAMLQAAGVLILLPVSAAIMEFVAHLVLDYMKNDGLLGEGTYGFILDQYLHVMCKVIYVMLFAYGII